MRCRSSAKNAKLQYEADISKVAMIESFPFAGEGHRTPKMRFPDFEDLFSERQGSEKKEKYGKR